MARKLSLGMLALAAILTGWLAPVAAQGDDPTAHVSPSYALNMRTGPGPGYDVITVLDPGTSLVLEGRNATASWILATTTDGIHRGWVSRYFLRHIEGGSRHLPVTHTVTIPDPELVIPADPGPSPDLSNIDLGGYDPSRVVGIDLYAYSVAGRSTGRAAAILRAGLAQGRDPHYVSKVGDCFTWHDYFLKPFAWGQYDLGEYGHLQGAIDYFGESFSQPSFAASPGFLAGAVMDSTWSDPNVCEEGESPLLCEYRVNNPAFAVIMFGTQDLLLMTPEQYDGYLREVIRQTIDARVVPVLSTFPGNLGMWDKTILYNQIVIRVALDFNIPLINLWRALDGLPNHGLGDDQNHLSFPLTAPADLTYPNLETGYAMRNLVTLQTLNALYRGLLQ